MVMRHAKSSWDDPRMDDHDRPLNARGLRTAPRMAAWLMRQGYEPDSITSSTAGRAEATARLVQTGLDTGLPIRLMPKLYHADLSAWEYVIRRLPAESRRALCVGHNPGIEMLFHALTGDSQRIPTATICVFDLEIDDWPSFDLQNSLGKWMLWRPKELPDDFGCENPEF